MTELELLAPARNLSTGIAAIDSGADAVYIGAMHHGARAAAGNSVDDIEKLCRYAHRFRARVYVTLNTLIYDEEIEEVEKLVRDLYKIGVDALIVQDMAFFKMNIPPIPLHASTQCDIRTVEKACFLRNIGFDRIVLPREMTLEEIRSVRESTDVPLEGFVHGALCVCYSGDCRASLVNGGRSANRGECAQICRLSYDLIDGNGKVVMANRHFLSLKDMNRIGHLAEMAEAGITSFKIEGRLKSENYVRNVVSAYSDALNQFVEANNDRFCRASYGSAQLSFRPDVNKAFNRGFTSYFLDDTQPRQAALASMLTPGHVGEKVAEVISVKDRILRVKTFVDISNGDGLAYFDENKKFIGFRVNRVEGDVLHLAKPLTNHPRPGTILYRNYDKAFDDQISGSVARRLINVRMRLDLMTGGIKLTLADERGCQVTEAVEIECDTARMPQREARRRALEKTGDTIYKVSEVVDDVPEDVFIPISALTNLRRRAVEALDSAAAATFPTLSAMRHTSSLPKSEYPKKQVDMHDNVSNGLSRRFYMEHGAEVVEPALEITLRHEKKQTPTRVMTTRYCLRRELGACLKKPEGRMLKEPLVLKSADGKTHPMALDFDCASCRMHVSALFDKE